MDETVSVVCKISFDFIDNFQDTRGHKNHRFFGFPKMNWATKARNVLVPRIWFTKNSGEDDDVTKKNQV